MLKNEVYQQSGENAQERGVYMDCVAAHKGISGSKLSNVINRVMTAFLREKIGSVIHALSPVKGVIKAVDLNGEAVVEINESNVDYVE